jgi:DNA-binding response OmpR family regulator
MKTNQSILVVDDDREILGILNRTLELEGYDVAIAADGRAALALLEEYRPDLVILDIIMPELDGFQVLNLIRQRSNIPVIMLTARCEITTLRDALALGADDYVRKPFRIRELLARIKAKLRRTDAGATVETGQPEQ